MWGRLYHGTLRIPFLGFESLMIFILLSSIIPNKLLQWIQKISFYELVKEMVDSDLKLAKND